MRSASRPRRSLIPTLPRLCTAALLLSWCATRPASAAEATGPLRVHPTNPRYFTDGSGKAIYLTGSHHWDNFQRWFEGQPGAPSGPAGHLGGFDDYLDVLQAHGHDFIRLWVADTAWSPITKAAIEPQPFVRAGPGKAADGGLKFDLNRLNQAYFDELRTRVLSAHRRGVYVGVMLFNGWGVGVYRDRPHNVTWDYHPFNKANNVNGIDGDPNGDRRGLECHSLQIAAITKLQETYVRKVLDTVNDLDNVLYEISNESGPTSAKWQCHLIRYIKSHEAMKPKQHPVIMSGGWGMPNADLFAGPADAVAPGNNPPKEKYAFDPPPATGTKVVLIDSDHNESDRTDPQFAWRSFLRGHNPIVMDWWNGPQWNPLRRALGHTRRYAEKMNLAAMTPRNDLASTTYCLANPGKEYLILQPAAEAPFTVNVQPGRYRLEWFRPETAKVEKTGEFQAVGGVQDFKAPFVGPALLYLTASFAGSDQLRQIPNVAKPPVIFPGKDWLKASPESQGVDPGKLQAAVDYLASGLKEYGGAGTVFIVRNGHVIWAGPDCDRQYQVFSATKSFTSTILGLLIDDGKVTLSTLAKDLEPALAQRYPAVTLRHFATMTSGYYSVGGSYEFDRQKRGDSWNPGPPAPPIFPPGSKFRYWDDAMMQFGSLLTKAAGEPLDRLFQRRIADPIGMTKWRWTENDSPVGRVLCWTGGIHTSSRELARFGHLLLNRGNWNGRQLISTSWVEQATSVQVPPSVPNDDLPRSRGAGVYGYNWWINGVKLSGQRLWPGAPPGTYYANGLHNNVCIVVPEWNMVIARTNGAKKGGGTNTPPNVDEIWSGFFARLAETVGHGASPASRDNPWEGWLDRKLLPEEEARSMMRGFLARQLWPLPLPQTREAWLARRDALRREVLAVLGIDDLVPPKWDLALKSKGTLHRKTDFKSVLHPGYRIEKITFESYPGMAIPAVVYVPEGISGRVPGIVSISGHTNISKAADYVQQRNVNLALRGCVVLSYDYHGYGERKTGNDPNHPTGANTHDIRSFSFSRRTATAIEVLDAIRAIDALLARPEVDPERIGFTGESGGSNSTYWVAAVDPRVTLAVPVSSVTTFDYWIRTDCNWDWHQRPPGIRRIADIGTLLALHAPHPLLIISSRRGTDDQEFPLEEAEKSYQWARHVYGLLGAEEAVTHYESTTAHGYQEDKREQLYRAVERWLRPPFPKGEKELPAKVERVEDLRCGLPEKNLTVRDIYAQWLKPLPRRSDPSDPASLRAFLRERLGWPQPLPAVKAERVGQADKGPWSAEFWILEPEPGIRLPAVRIGRRTDLKSVPPGAAAPITLVPGRDKQAVARVLEAGGQVLALDLRGAGEIAPAQGNVRNWAWFAGRPWPGLWALDLVQAARFSREKLSAPSVAVDAENDYDWPALLAGAAAPDLISSGSVRVPRASLREGLLARGDHALADVPGLLERLDIPQLRGLWPGGQVSLSK